MEMFNKKNVYLKLFYILCSVCYLTMSCDIFQYECNDGSCIPETWYCDQDNDCGDGGDEADCSVCLPHWYKCNDGNCISPSWLCDDYPDCENGDDEENCSGGAGTTYISKEEMTTKHTSTNIYNVFTVKTSKAPVSSTIDRMTTKMVDIITTGYDRKTTRITDSLRTTSFDEKSTTNVITGNLSVIKQTTVYDGASSFQENKQAQDGQMGNKKKIIYGIIAGSTIAVVIGVGVMIGAGIFLKYRHHKQRVRKINNLPIQQTDLTK